MKIALLILCLSSFLFSQEFFRISSSNIVKNPNNKLVWVDNKEIMTFKLSHKEAEPYCEDLVHAGIRNWRLPTLKEFKTIVDKTNERTYTQRAFKYSRPNGFWAIKAHIRTFWFYADYMNFISGTAYYDNRNKKKFVRCVASTK